GVDAHRDRDREWLRHSERDRLDLGRERAVQPVEDVPAEHEGDHRSEDERSQRDNDPAAELVEMLAESRLLGVAETARKPCHAPARRSRARAAAPSSAWATSAWPWARRAG